MPLKLLLLGAILLSTTLASTPFSCVVNGGSPLIVRVEGITEMLGDLYLQCSGGTPTSPGQPIPTSDIQVTLNTGVTGRLLAGAITEATLAIDEPYPPAAQLIPNNYRPLSFAVPQMLCPLQGSAAVACPETGTGGTPSPYSTQPNVFLGTLISANTIKWQGIPLDPPGTFGILTVRITNVRANASALGLSNTAIPTQAVVTVSATGTGAPTLMNPQQTIAYVQSGLKISTTAAALSQCADHNSFLVGGAGTPSFDFTVVGKEGYSQAFARRTAAVTDGITSPAAAAQNAPGYAYNTESTFYAPLLFTATPNVGLADFGSRLQLTISNVSGGTHLFVPATIQSTIANTSVPVEAAAAPPPLPAGIAVAQLRLVSTDQYGVSASSYVAVPATAAVAGTPVAEMSYTGGTAYAVYEVVGNNQAAVEQATIPVAVAYTSSTQHPVGAGVVTASFGFAPAGDPLSTITTADLTAPVPRFAVPATIWTAYSIQSCGPETPSNPAPSDSATGLSTGPPTLSWQGSSNPATYDVYFGTSALPPQVASNVSGTNFSTAALRGGTKYYWQVIAKNPWGSSPSPVWLFTTAPAPDIAIAFTHLTAFTAGQTGSFMLTVSNDGNAATSGPVSVNDLLPPGLTLASVTGSGWMCTGTLCTRSDTLNPGSSYPPLTFVVNVAVRVPSLVINYVGSLSAPFSDPITISPAIPPVALGFFPLTPCRAVDTRASQGKTGSFGSPALTAYAGRDFPLLSSGCGIPNSAQAYSVNLTVVPPGTLDFLSAWQTGQSYPGVSNLNSTDGSILANAAILSAGTNGAVTVVAGKPTDLIIDINGYFAPPNGQELVFYPVTPCRLADTRGGQGKSGAFGPPSILSYAGRDFPVANACGVPTSAKAYSLNMTVVPGGRLDFLSTWPTGQTYPNVSTLNSADGSVIANAAIVPAGTNGSITVLAANPTDLIIDVNGYFAPRGSPGALHFYAMPPCRMADTRNGQGTSGAFGQPGLTASGSRDLAIPLSNCDVAQTAQAYALNVTVVPQGHLDFLSMWPTGKAYPNVSTLNSPKGTVLANTAIVPAGTNGAITVLAGNPSDVIIDISGYFAP